MKFEMRDASKFKKKGKKLLYYRYEIHVVLINGKIIVGWYLFYEHKKNRRFKSFQEGTYEERSVVRLVPVMKVY